MRINNISIESSKRIIFILALFAIFATGFYIVAYLMSDANSHSFVGFFKWIVPFIKYLLTVSEEDKFFIFLLSVVLPIFMYAGLIWEIVKKINSSVKFNSELNLKSIDLNEDIIKFNFNQPQYNFYCGYHDIENLDMNIITTIVHTKNGTYTGFQELELNFRLLNNKNFTLKNATISPMKLIYKVLYYTRNVQNFSYRFSGAGEIEDIKEKIENYRRTGKKRVLGESGENSLLLLSIIFSIFAFIFIWFFRDTVDDFVKDPGMFFVYIPFLGFSLISLVIDIFLVVNQLQKKGYYTCPRKYENRFAELIDKFNIWHLLMIKLAVIIFLVVTCFQPLIFAQNDKKILIDNNPAEFKTLKVNLPSEYNYLSKEQIYKIRKKYVKNSIFYKDGYEPSEEVFGQIVDNKPWWGLIACGQLNYTGDYHERIEGDSKVSIQMNNPNALVGLSLAYLPWDVEQTHSFCTSEYSKYTPLSLKYNEKDNLIIAKYDLPEEFLNVRVNIDGQSKRIPVQLSGLNALDFGYRYVWAFDFKNIKMLHQDEKTVLDEVIQFRDYVHLGGSCRYEGGCNNISPMQQELMLTITNLPAEIDLKLWKKEPMNKFHKADFYYKIVFE